MEEPWAKRLRTRSEAAASGGAAAAGAAAATRAEKRSLASITIARGRRCPFRVLRLHAREARVSQYRKKNKKPMKRGGQEAFRIVSCEIGLEARPPGRPTSETKYSSAADAVSVSHVVLLLRHPEAT